LYRNWPFGWQAPDWLHTFVYRNKYTLLFLCSVSKDEKAAPLTMHETCKV
jgi:hypothetical protein